jgi:hypothetical protein
MPRIPNSTLMRHCNYARSAFLIGLLACLAVLSPLTASASSEKSWRFRVFLDDKEIGYHHFYLTRDGAHEKLSTEAKFAVHFLKIPLFKYSHSNVELWNSRCLKRIASSTDENGRQFQVQGAVDGQVFQLSTHSGDTTLPACISTFAYWDKSFLKRTHLLNSQTGEYLEIEVEYLGQDSIRVRNTNTPAHHYKLNADKASIELWYSQEDHWLALRSTTRNGRVLRYVIE